MHNLKMKMINLLFEILAKLGRFQHFNILEKSKDEATYSFITAYIGRKNPVFIALLRDIFL